MELMTWWGKGVTSGSSETFRRRQDSQMDQPSSWAEDKPSRDQTAGGDTKKSRSFVKGSQDKKGQCRVTEQSQAVGFQQQPLKREAGKDRDPKRRFG